MKNQINQIKDILNINGIENYFVSSLYDIQTILLGHGVHNSETQDVESIKRIYIESFSKTTESTDEQEYIEHVFESNSIDFNFKNGTLDGDFGGITVFATTSLHKPEINGLYDSTEVDKQILDFSEIVKDGITNFFINNVDPTTRELIIELFFKLVFNSYKSLENIQNDIEDIKDEENLVIHTLALQYKNELKWLIEKFKSFIKADYIELITNLIDIESKPDIAFEDELKKPSVAFKVIFANELGIFEYLKTQYPYLEKNNTNFAKLLHYILGDNQETIRRLINDLRTGERNDPYKTEDNLVKSDSLFIRLKLRDKKGD